MKSTETPHWILVLQFLSIAWIWVFVLGISGWIIHLIGLSRTLNDVPSASIGISIVAIPVFFTGAGVLSYVFWGLRRAADDEGQEPENRGVES